VLEWLFGRRAQEGRDGAAERPGLADRPLDVAPPREDGRRCGVTVHPASSTAHLGAHGVRAAESRLGPADGVPGGDGLAWAAVLLVGERPGDVLFLSAGPAQPPAGAVALLDGPRGGEEDGPAAIERDALSGEPVTGVTGARLLARTPLRAVLRFGPPPAARWAVQGLRSVAVFRGKLTLVDGEDGREVVEGEVAFVADPTATLHVQAGNDAAVAIAFAAPDFAIRLQ